jgi:spermidine synthase
MGRLIVLAVGALGVSCVMTQLALMRELLGAFSGNELVLGVVLGNWLLLLGLGTWLGGKWKFLPERVENGPALARKGGGRAPSSLGQLQKPLAVFIVLQLLVAILPLLQVLLLRALRNLIFIRGASVGVGDTVVSALLLLLPYGLAAGCALTLACALLAREQGVAGIGRVYVADSIGSVAGGILFSFVLVRFFDHASILVFPAVLNLLAGAALGFRAGHKRLAALAGTLAAAIVALAVLVDLDGVSTGWQYWPQYIVARANSPYGKLVVTESDGQFDFIENGIPLTSTRDDQRVEEAVHYAMAQRSGRRKVLLIGGGISGTAREILKYPVSRVDYVELDPVILELGRKYLPENLADNRIRIINTDGRWFVRQTAEKYEVVIVDVPAPSTAQLNRFFTAEFFAQVKRVLAPDGVMSFGLGHYENYVSPELARLLASAAQSLHQSFPNVLVLPGGQVFFLASNGPLFPDIAARIAQQGIQTKLMNRHYLDAMLTTDRMADMQRAIAQPAALNRDLSPVLYYYHLRHWMSQFKSGFGVLPALWLILVGVYLVRLRGAALVLFASGFAATALELVLLLAFQVLCGSVYHQVGIIVTVFMAGLALGAIISNRPATGGAIGGTRGIGGASACLAVASERRPVPARRLVSSLAPPNGSSGLACLAFAIAGYALLLAFCLPLLVQAGDTALSNGSIKGIIAALTFLLAVLVGTQFPLANRLAYDGTVAGASRLYTADFAGAFLGAFLVSTLLIPLIGVTGVCLLTAALNLLAGATMFQLRKAMT